MKDILVGLSLEVRIGDLKLNITRGLEPALWRQKPLLILEQEVRDMLVQMLAPSVTAYDQACQALASLPSSSSSSS